VPESIAPWVARVGGQLHAALAALESEMQRQPPDAQRLTQGSLTAAVVWHFTRQLLPLRADAARHPALAAWSTTCEALPAFAAAPHGDGVVAAEPGKP
jgi:glutathione S-transferase